MRRFHIFQKFFIAWCALAATGCDNTISTSLDGKACDSLSRCSSGYVCSDGLCVRPDAGEPACDAGCSTPTTVMPAPCAEGSVACGETCVQTKADPKNCGVCGHVCAKPVNGAAVCSAGQCGESCNTGYVRCAGACVNEAADPKNCGGCGVSCNAGATCGSGVCVPSCGAQTRCGAMCVDTTHDPNNCGACGVVCGTAPCANGQCGQVCAVGTSSCDKECVNLGTDPKNCGSCGNHCKGAQTCALGSCAP
jgi:hypothetical protein